MKNNLVRWVETLLGLAIATAIVFKTENSFYRSIFAIAFLLIFLLVFIFKYARFGKSILAKPTDIIYFLAISGIVLGTILIAVFGNGSMVTLSISFLYFLLLGIYIFSQRSRLPSQDWKENKLVLLWATPLLIIGVVIIIGIPLLFIYAWFFL